MKPSEHLVLSGGAGATLWAFTGELWALPVTVGTGVLIDMDHALDFVWNFALERKAVAVLLLHSWEWLAVLMLLGAWLGFSWWLLAVMVGYGLHVATDHAFNGGGRWLYSLAFRARHGFQRSRISPGWDREHAYLVLKREVPPAAWFIEWWKRRWRGRPATAGELGTAD